MGTFQLAPKATAKLNLVSDVVCIFGAAWIASIVHGSGLTAETALFAGAAACMWLMGSFVLRFYDPWSRRLALDDAALLSLLVLGEALFLGAIHFTWGRE